MSIKPMRMPTLADVATRRIAQLKETISKTIAEGDLDLYLELVEQLVEEGPHSIAEIAAAAARLASPKSLAPESGGKTPSPVPTADEGRVRLRMDVGKRDGIRPTDVVGSIANEANIPGRDIGPIEIRDDVTYVTVPARSAEHIVSRVGRARFRGRPVNLRVADSGQERRPRRDDRDQRRGGRFDGSQPDRGGKSGPKYRRKRT